MKRMPVLASALLVSITFLLSTLCPHSAAADAAETNLSQSLEKVKDFHDRFKDPTFSARGHGYLSLSSGLANETDIFAGSTWQMGGLVAIDTNSHREIAYDGYIEPSSSRANFLEIDVSRITVIAINMAKGGNAVATSDINLNPAQYLVFSSEAEVDYKLK
jgi:hypothetical protein